MKKAIQIWQELPTNDCIELINRYGKGMMPYELQHPTEQQIISVLLAAFYDNYLITPFVEQRLKADKINRAMQAIGIRG